MPSNYFRRRRHRRSKKHLAQSPGDVLLRGRRPVFERLENRRMLAGLFPGVHGTGVFVPTGQFADAPRSQIVLLGDLDGDGDVDALTQAQSSGPATVWANNGQAVFANTWQGNLGGPFSTTVYDIQIGDLDNDNDLDILAATPRGGQVWTNNGNGQFTILGAPFGGDDAGSVLLGDFDSDGDLDAVLQSSDQEVAGLWFNDGNANFTHDLSTIDLFDYSDLAIGDLDGDGDVDLVITRSLEVSIYTNDGAANFTLAHQETRDRVDGLAVNDFDADGDLDVLIVDRSTPTRYLENSGQATFSESAARSQFHDASLRFADIDGDGDLDAINRSEIFLNDSTGAFVPSVHPLPFETTALEFADLDGDGDLDAFAIGQQHDAVWLNADVDLRINIASAPNSPWAAPSDVIAYDVEIRNDSPWQATTLELLGLLTGPVDTLTITSVDASPGITGALPLGPLDHNWTNELTIPGNGALTYRLSTTVFAEGDPRLGPADEIVLTTSLASQSGQTIGLPIRTEQTNSRIVLAGQSEVPKRLVPAPNRFAPGLFKDVALGDLDGDGVLDAFVAQGSLNNQVWLGDGAGSFTDTGQRLETISTNQFGDGASGQVALADIDDDGDLDAVVSSAGGMRLWINSGAAQFVESPIRFIVDNDPFTERGQSVILEDMDSDGDIDIVSLSASSSSSVHVWLNDGAGQFPNSTSTPSPRHDSAEAADIDGDGDLDIVTNEATLFNDGAGVLTSVGRSSRDIAALGDLDGDGDADLIEARTNGDTTIRLNDGSGQFLHYANLSNELAEQLTAIEVADFDGDGDLDFFQITNNGVNLHWLNDGLANFTISEQQFPVSPGVNGKAADLDGDGDMDLVIANSYGGSRAYINAALTELVDLEVTKSALPLTMREGDEFSYAITVSNPTGTDVLGATFVEALSSSIASGDLVAIQTTGGAVAAAAAGPIGAGFTDTLDLPALSSVTYEITTSVAAPDAANRTARQTAVTSARIALPADQYDLNLENNQADRSSLVEFGATAGTATFARVYSRDVFEGRDELVELGDMNGDGFLDVVLAGSGSRTRIWLGRGDGTFQVDVQVLPPQDDTRSLVLGDADGDGDLDVLVANNQDLSRLWLNDGSGFLVESAQSFESFHASNLHLLEAHRVTMADVDGDGDNDILFSASSHYTVWQNDGDGHFTDTGQRHHDSTSTPVFGDIDGDGDLDALGHVDTLINDGGGLFHLSSTSIQRGDRLLGDVDGDGDIDAISFLGFMTSVWLNDGTGDFIRTDQQFEAVNYLNAQFADFDNDGDIDFLAFQFASDARVMFLNDGSGFFERQSLTFGDGGGRVFAVGDLNNDGAIDHFVLEGGPLRQHQTWLNASADVGVAIQDLSDSETTHEGQTVRYVVTASNDGGVDAPSGKVDFFFDPNIIDVQLLTVTPSAGTASSLTPGAKGREISDSVGLPQGGEIEYVFEVTVGGPLLADSVPNAFVGMTARVSPGPDLLDGVITNNLAIERNQLVLVPQGGSGLLERSSQQLPDQGSRVALGDLDGDGDIDAYLATASATSVLVLLNDGAGNFTSNGQTFTGRSVRDVKLGDLDGDGDLDAIEIASNFDSRVMLNNGSGQFSVRPVGLPSSFGNVESITLIDIDGDGDLDGLPVDGSSRLLLNNGHARFYESTLLDIDEGPAYPGDFDGDGDIDFAYPSDFAVEQGVALFDRSSSPWNRRSQLAVGDIDGDGDLDVLSSESTTSNATHTWINDGAGQFTQAAQSITEGSLLALADFNNDGSLDVIVDGEEIWLNDGSGVFIETGLLIRTDTSSVRHTAVADFDVDGDIDVFFAGVTNEVWFNRSGDDFADLEVTTLSSQTSVVQGEATEYTVVVSNVGSTNVIGADFQASFSSNLNNLELSQITAAGGATSTLTIGALGDHQLNALANLPIGSSLTLQFTALVESAGASAAAAEATVSMNASITAPAELFELTPSNNFSGDVDLVELATTGGLPSLERLDDVLPSTRFTSDVALGDLDGDGDLDLYVANDDRLPDKVWINQGNGQYVDSGQSLGNQDSGAVALVDLDRDGDLDAITGGGSWRNIGGGVFEQLQTTIASSADRLLMGDFNGDGWIDAFARQHIFLNDGSGILTPTDQPLRDPLSGAAMGDVDGDGDLDLIGEDFDPEVWLNDGNGFFTLSEILGGRQVPVSGLTTLADFDGDGDLDAVFGGFGKSVWLNDGSGSFAPTNAELSLGARDVEALDIDNDGDLDLLIAADTFQPQHILLNDGSANFTLGDDTYGSTFFFALASGDIDNDGDIDAITTLDSGVAVLFNLDSPAPYDVTIESTANRASFAPGETATYTITVTNDGPRDVANVEIVDTAHGLFSTFRLVTATAAGGAVTNIATGTYAGQFIDVVDLPVGSSIVYQVELTAPALALPNQTPIAVIGNGAVASLRLGDSNDLTPENNRTVSVTTLSNASEYGTGFFTETPGDLGAGLTAQVILGDIDNDGLADALIVGLSGTTRVLRSDGSELVDLGQTINTTHALGGTLADLDNDGDLDFLPFLGDDSTAVLNTIWLNDGDGNFNSAISVSESFRDNSFSITDLDGDGDLDAFGADSLWLNDGAASFTPLPVRKPLLEFSSDNKRRHLSLGDIDGDGDTDAIASAGSTRVLRNDGAGLFTEMPQNQLPFADRTALGDVDGDGDLDILADYHLLLNDGLGNYSTSAELLDDDSRDVVDAKLIDIDGDGDLDAFVASTTSSRMWLNDGAGNFDVTYQIFSTPDVASVEFADINGDGDLDLVTASQNGSIQQWRQLDAPEVTELSVSKVASPDLYRGDSLTYRIEVRNDGPSDVFAQLQDTYDAALSNLQLVSVSSSGGATTSLTPGAFSHQLQDRVMLPIGGSVTLEVTADTPAGLGAHMAAEGSITSYASIDVEGDALESVPSNNKAVTHTILHQQGEGSGLLVNSRQELGDAEGVNVALGDLDGDGDLDAFVASYAADQVWLNDGQAVFSQTSQIFADSRTDDVALADFDFDGDLDAFLTTIDSGSQLWINDGAGQFSNAMLDLGDRHGLEVQLLDIDGDGDIDAVVNHASGNAWQVWLNDGLGDLSSESFVLADASRGAALGDLDGDGDADAFSAGLRNDRFVYFSEAPGAPFGDPIFYFSPSDSSTSRSKPVALGDFDGDGDLDVFSGTDGLDRIWTNDGAGVLTPGPSLFSFNTQDVALGDLNGDRQLDLLAAASNSDSGSLLGGHAPSLLSTGSTQGVALGDLDADGDIDAFFVDHSGLQVWLNAVATDVTIAISGAASVVLDEEATYEVTVTNRGPAAAEAVAIASNLNQLLNNLEVSAIQSTAGVLTQLAVGPLSQVQQGDPIDYVRLPAGGSITYTLTGLPGKNAPHATATDATLPWVVEVSRDDPQLELDAIDNRATANQVVVRSVSGGGASFTTADAQLFGTNNTDVQLGDFDDDGDLDMLVFSRFNQTSYVLNNGPEGFQNFSLGTGNVDAFAAGLGDFDEDGDLDAVIGTRLDGAHTLRYVDGRRPFSYHQQEGDGQITRDIVTGDLNGDGKPDAIELNQGDESWVLIGQGDNTLIRASSFPAGSSPVRGALGDLDGDGDLDLVIANDHSQPSNIMLNDGAGNFSSVGAQIGGNATGVALGDLDGDGDLDIVTSSAALPNKVWINDGQATFQEQTIGLLAGASAAVALADMDGDGDLDAVFASTGPTPSQVVFNEGGVYVEALPLAGGYYSSAVAVGDLDGNGTLDIVFAGTAQTQGGIWFNNDLRSLGDFDRNGAVDANDYGVWRATFGQTGPNLQADANADQIVNAVDYAVWREHLDETIVQQRTPILTPENLSQAATSYAGDGQASSQQAAAFATFAAAESSSARRPNHLPLATQQELSASSMTSNELLLLAQDRAASSHQPASDGELLSRKPTDRSEHGQNQDDSLEGALAIALSQWR